MQLSFALVFIPLHLIRRPLNAMADSVGKSLEWASTRDGSAGAVVAHVALVGARTNVSLYLSTHDANQAERADRVFVHALNTVKKLPRGTHRPPPADRLRLYGLYKQSMGMCRTRLARTRLFTPRRLDLT